jgi:hypothetical protein
LKFGNVLGKDWKGQAGRVALIALIPLFAYSWRNLPICMAPHDTPVSKAFSKGFFSVWATLWVTPLLGLASLLSQRFARPYSLMLALSGLFLLALWLALQFHGLFCDV